MLEIEKLIRSNPTNENYLFTKENILRFNSDSFNLLPFRTGGTNEEKVEGFIARAIESIGIQIPKFIFKHQKAI